MKNIILKKKYSLIIAIASFFVSTTVLADCPDKVVSCFKQDSLERKKLSNRTGTCWQKLGNLGIAAVGDVFGWGCRWCTDGEKIASEKCVKEFGPEFSRAKILLGTSMGHEVHEGMPLLKP